MAETETREDTRGESHATILVAVVVKADESTAKIPGTLVAMCYGNFARPHFTADGNLHPQTTGGVICLPARHLVVPFWTCPSSLITVLVGVRDHHDVAIRIDDSELPA